MKYSLFYLFYLTYFSFCYWFEVSSCRLHITKKRNLVVRREGTHLMRHSAIVYVPNIRIDLWVREFVVHASMLCARLCCVRTCDGKLGMQLLLRFVRSFSLICRCSLQIAQWALVQKPNLPTVDKYKEKISFANNQLRTLINRSIPIAIPPCDFCLHFIPLSSMWRSSCDVCLCYNIQPSDTSWE
jgi:hypothetical protein